jgi:1-deoxy-D-xylulose-5-phosphate synthase
MAAAASSPNALADAALMDCAQTPEGLRMLPRSALPDLAAALRVELVRTVSQTGGHLGAGLGVVELTIALHHLFDTPRDVLIWDVGHQAYPHKMLTGRRAEMGTMRQGGGLSGFTKRDESPFDPFGAAHAATSISAALGFCAARDRTLGDDRHVLAVIGDGSLSAGMAYEALNVAADATKRLIVIVNDNGMSIAPAVGGVSRALERGGAGAFSALGFTVLGPVDGHDFPALFAALEAAKAETDRPVLIHLRTQKGKGYAPAEAAPDNMHGVVKFDIATGVQAKAKAKGPSYTEVFSQSLQHQAEGDPRIVAVTAAMPAGTGLDAFAARFPERFFDVGIAEQHAVTFAAGLAAGGMAPFAAIYSSFLQRGYDQVVHDVALQRLPVRFALDRAGLVGADGATHAGSFDIGYLGALPHFVVMAPADAGELARMIATAAAIDDGPCAVRYPRGVALGACPAGPAAPLDIGRGRILREGASVALLSFGHRFVDALEAADRLLELGVSVTLADARFAKPLDAGLLQLLAREHEILITLEEGAMGGFGAFVLQHLAGRGLLDRGLKVRTLHLPDVFQAHDTQDAQVRAAGLCADSIVACALSALGRAAQRSWLSVAAHSLDAALTP